MVGRRKAGRGELSECLENPKWSYELCKENIIGEEIFSILSKKVKIAIGKADMYSPTQTGLRSPLISYILIRHSI